MEFRPRTFQSQLGDLIETKTAAADRASSCKIVHAGRSALQMPKSVRRVAQTQRPPPRGGGLRRNDHFRATRASAAPIPEQIAGSFFSNPSGFQSGLLRKND